ncbi:hypothetical protein ISS07_01570 [Candidatus Woesearchaeota archaeon]|nr:hypothetical protein [Candidatus Woesearchaeota archaeon]
MFALLRSKTDKKISNLHRLLERSFLNVKKDTQNIFQWLNFLYQKNMQQENTIKQLQLELSYIPKRPEDIRKIIDSHYSFDNMMERIKMLNERMDTMHVKPSQTTQSAEKPRELYELEKRLSTLEEQRKATIRDKVVKRVTRNSKDYVKNLIFSYIRKYGQISSLQLKEMVVIDQGLCSKSSFYRILEELEEQAEVSIARRGKQKYYLYKHQKQH